mmetsp:Transcript_52211/g.62875  ORF Transcript_52211/g.62875 Transcript_52211/m.62875 type:complete len:207 (-) Transcript_52211:826-1446(-)
MNKLMRIAREQFNIIRRKTQRGKHHLIQQKIQMRLEHFIRGRQLHRQINVRQTQMHHAIGTKLSRRTQVQRLTNRTEKLRRDIHRKMLRKVLHLVFRVSRHAVPRKQPRHYLYRPLFYLPPRPRVSFSYIGRLPARFEAGGCFRERFGNDCLDDVEPGLYRFGAGERSTDREVELSAAPKYLENLFQHQCRFQGMFCGETQTLRQR